jgi:hypothetical protein
MYIGHKVVDYKTCMGLSNYGTANMLLKSGQLRLACAGFMQHHIIETLYNFKRQRCMLSLESKWRDKF